MDAATILDALDTLTVADLRTVAERANDLLRFYDEMARSSPNVVEQHSTAGGCLRLELVTCGKATCKCASGELHGPYWYKYSYKKGGGQRKTYIGKQRPDQAG